MDLKSIANRLIPKPKRQQVLLQRKYSTGDIIRAVLDKYGECSNDLAAFAPYLKGADLYTTCRNVWQFVKSNIRYEIDPQGVQLVKSPAAVWSTKFCDCKSYSVFIACLLKGLGIKGAFRFASFDRSNPDPTHVYVVVKNGGREIIIDDVLGSFDTEEPYQHKHDYNMEGLYSISGTPKKRIAGLPRLGEVSTAKDSLDMKILHDRLEIEQKLLNRRAGGALPEEVNAIYNQWKRDVVEHATVSGIGIHGLIPNPKSLLSNIKGELKDAAVEHFDKAAPLYVYNFVNSDAALNKLPSTVRNKRVSSKNAMNTFAGVGVSADQAMGVIRNGAMKVMVNTPEQYFANELTKLQVSRLSGPKVGVIVPGDAEIAFKILKDAGAFLKKVWDWIKKLFGGKVSVKVPNEENHIADQTDWAGFQPDVATVEAVGGQASNQTMIEKYGAQIAAAIANGQDVVALVAQLKQQMENEPAENGGAIKTEKEVTVTSKPKEKSDNTGLLLGLAGLGAAAYFLTKKKGKR